MKCSVKELILFGVLAAILTISQVSLSFIPNVETVSLLIILYSLIYEKNIDVYSSDFCNDDGTYIWIWNMVVWLLNNMAIIEYDYIFNKK